MLDVSTGPAGCGLVRDCLSTHILPPLRFAFAVENRGKATSGQPLGVSCVYCYDVLFPSKGECGYMTGLTAPALLGWGLCVIVCAWSVSVWVGPR